MPSPAEAFLRHFHDARPGVTARAFAKLAITVAGRHYDSSYELLADTVPRDTQAVRVLDMGCGDGHLLARLACRQPAGLQLIGIDISRSELA
ncbi:MAG: methyltransferase domain-containing protein [Burkholderiaceae bacterium]